MNTTSSKKNMIHLSEGTANILQAFGKAIGLREDKVNAKGKGELTTYWPSRQMDHCQQRAMTARTMTSMLNLTIF